ncbi:MAG: rhomboid family intramembrane serine protease, partial [Phycisphaerales bacterium]|nr:rhomboid family intramembrane serine protease [Phycisphaerales bacterium]
MGVADRDYVRKRARGGDAGAAGGRWLTMTWMLIIANTAVHAVRAFFGQSMQVTDRFRQIVLPNGHAVPWVEDWLVNAGHFSIGRALFFTETLAQQGTQLHLRLEVWRFVSYQFLHADWFHLFFNMFGLFVFGPIVEDAMGRRKFLAFVLVCGVFGALTYVLLNLAGQVVMMANGGQAVRIPGLLFADPLTPLVGASAGVFGVIMACAHVAPNTLIDIPL